MHLSKHIIENKKGQYCEQWQNNMKIILTM